MGKLLQSFGQDTKDTLTKLISENNEFFRWFTSVTRIMIAIIAFIIVCRIVFSLLRGKRTPETWGFFNLPNGMHVPIHHWENLIGRAKNCDVILNVDTVSRNHATLIRRDDGRWNLTDLGSKAGISVNGEKVEKEEIVKFGDIINIGGVDINFVGLSPFEQKMQHNREVPGREIKPALTMYLLTVLNILLCMQLCFSKPQKFEISVPFGFILVIATMWLYYLLIRMTRRRGFEIEQIAFFLTTIGFSVVIGSNPNEITKTLLAMFFGILLLLALGWFLRDLTRANAMRWPMAATALGLLLISIVAGRVVNGAKNWVFIGSYSLQPSEFAKICFIYAGTATLDRLFAKRNLIMYMILTVCIGGALAYTSDFGAAIIFFVAFLLIAFMRSGDVATISLIVLAAALGMMLLLKFKPYIAYRFSSWRHVWDVPHDGGYQQTRTMSAAASGGLFGVGAGNGWLRNIVAADTDLVFGIVVEELGLIVGICCILSILTLVVFSYISAANGRSTFYTIAACTASSMLLFQVILNVLGSLDILPLTGVTFPFVSNGGSSMLACYGMLAFPKAVDTRRLASFALKGEPFSMRRRRRAK